MVDEARPRVHKEAICPDAARAGAVDPECSLLARRTSVTNPEHRARFGEW
jgi:hypothetical protein